MIRIRIKGRPDRIEGFLIWGHAQSAPHGRDIVCAAVSAIATTALIGLAKHIPGHFSHHLLPQGLIRCRLLAGLPKEGAKEAQIILGTMLLGLEAVRQSYRHYIDLAYWR